MPGFTMPQTSIQPGLNALAQGLQYRQERNAHNALAAAIQSGDPTGVQNALAKVSPMQAIQYGQQREAASKEEQKQKLMWGAGMVANAKTPEAKAQAYAQVAPELRKLGGPFANISDVYDDSVDGMVNTILGRTPKEAGPQNISAGGALVDPTTGKVIYQAPFKPETPNLQPWQNPDGSINDTIYNAERGLRIAGSEFRNNNPAPQQPPSGYQHAPGGLAPIPGGPADPNAPQKPAPPGRIPAEQASRVALGKSYASQVPDILASIAEGTTSGGLGTAQVASGFGKGAAVARRQKSGVDALIRSLTGAGMNLAEAAEYADRYRIQATDSADTQTSKVLQLVQELRTTDEMIHQQYGQTPSKEYDGIASPANLSDELGGQTKRAGVPVSPKSKAEFDALPSGSRFTAPDGSIRVKP